MCSYTCVSSGFGTVPQRKGGPERLGYCDQQAGSTVSDDPDGDDILGILYRNIVGIWFLLSVPAVQHTVYSVYQLITLFLISLVLAMMIQFGKTIPAEGFMLKVTYYPFFLFGYYTSDWDLKFCRNIWFQILSIVLFCALFAMVWRNPGYFPVATLTTKWVFAGVLPFYHDIAKLEFLVFTLLHYVVGFAFFFFTWVSAHEEDTT